MGNIVHKRKSWSADGTDVNFDHFQVMRAIGKGSFGKVCIVKKKSTDFLFAMKYMNKAQCEGKDAVFNVFREIEILATLDHPFLVNLWFSFQDEEDMFMVVDLLLGGDLRYHVQQGIAFSDESVRLFILEIGSALDYLHKRHIIHRDIKPDNLLLDNEGHIHLTDFNIAAVLKEGHLATSMSGTKPYMAPEVFECACDCCVGYSYHIDWWSLGVTAYEVRSGKRPYDIHADTPLTEVRLMFLIPPRYPTDWNKGFAQIFTKLLTLSPTSRITSLEALLRMPFASGISANDVIKKRFQPLYIPPNDHVNCDPTFELEEMIIESKPLHKKKKRLLKKQKSLRENQSITANNPKTNSSNVYEKMLIYNREKVEIRKAKEKKEREWQEELDRSMNLSDPTGQGSTFCGRKLSYKSSKRPSHSNKKQEDVKDGVLGTLITASVMSLSATIGPVQGLKMNEEKNTKEIVAPTITEPMPKNAQKNELLETEVKPPPLVTLPKETDVVENVPSNNNTDELNLSTSSLPLDGNQEGLEDMKIPSSKGSSAAIDEINERMKLSSISKECESVLSQTITAAAEPSQSSKYPKVKESDDDSLFDESSVQSRTKPCNPTTFAKHNHKAIVNLKETMRSLSFNKEPEKRHEKFLPQRNSCNFRIQDINPIQDEDDFFTQKSVRPTKANSSMQTISLQSYSPSPIYTNNLEYIRGCSSSSSLLCNTTRPRLSMCPKSSSDDSILRDPSKFDDAGTTSRDQETKRQFGNASNATAVQQVTRATKVKRCYKRAMSTDSYAKITHQNLYDYLSQTSDISVLESVEKEVSSSDKSSESRIIETDKNDEIFKFEG